MTELGQSLVQARRIRCPPACTILSNSRLYIRLDLAGVCFIMGICLVQHEAHSDVLHPRGSSGTVFDSIQCRSMDEASHPLAFPDSLSALLMAATDAGKDIFLPSTRLCC